VLSDVDITALVSFHRARAAEATIHLVGVEDPSAFGVVPTDADGRVDAFIEKPPPGTAPTNHINAGTYVLEPSVLTRIPGGRKVSIERETFPALVAERTLYALALDGYWLDTGRPDQYLQANFDVLDGRRAGGRAVDAIASGAQVNGDVVHSVVGAGAHIAMGALVTDCVVLPGARVGAGAVIHSSIVGPRAIIGGGSRLVRCVIGADVNVAPNTSLVDARVPEPH
jgi:mannose-1-phosphate guanylyltransferase